MGPVDKPHLGQSKAEEQAPKSRRQRKAEKEINKNMNVLLNKFFTFKMSHKDQQGKEVADKFSELNGVWKNFAHRWKSSYKRMKLSDQVFPTIDAFENRIGEFNKSIDAQTKAKEEKNGPKSEPKV